MKEDPQIHNSTTQQLTSSGMNDEVLVKVDNVSKKFCRDLKMAESSMLKAEREFEVNYPMIFK